MHSISQWDEGFCAILCHGNVWRGCNALSACYNIFFSYNLSFRFLLFFNKNVFSVFSFCHSIELHGRYKYLTNFPLYAAIRAIPLIIDLVRNHLKWPFKEWLYPGRKKRGGLFDTRPSPRGSPATSGFRKFRCRPLASESWPQLPDVLCDWRLKGNCQFSCQVCLTGIPYLNSKKHSLWTTILDSVMLADVVFVYHLSALFRKTFLLL